MKKISEDDAVFQKMDTVTEEAWRLIESVLPATRENPRSDFHDSMSRDELIAYLRSGINDRCSREVRFLGNDRIVSVLETVVDEFEMDVDLTNWCYRY